MRSIASRLSLLNLRGLLATLGIVPASRDGPATPLSPHVPAPRRRPIACWRCPECFETHDDEIDAAECCEPTPAEADASRSACPVCGAVHPNCQAAADCCLWKDLDPPTRWRMAAAVEAGSTWSEQLGLRP